MIRVNHIVKSYGKKEKLVAVNDISFNVNEGEIFGLIGPDGAGKSSIYRILTTLLLPDSGSAAVNGFDIVKDFKQIRKCVGYMPGKFSLYQDLTIEENLNFFATIFNTSIQENYYLIKDIYQQIEPFKNRRAGKLSGGMKQKLALSCALIHKPAVLFLDEPTTGVDAVSRKEFWQMLKNLQQQGLTIMVSTPYMDEAALCDRIALIQSGNILSIGSPTSIENNFDDVLYGVHSSNIHQALLLLRNYENTMYCFAFGDSIHLTLKNGASEQEVIDYLQNKNFTDIVVEKIRPTIEDSFIKLLKNTQ